MQFVEMMPLNYLKCLLHGLLKKKTPTRSFYVSFLGRGLGLVLRGRFFETSKNRCNWEFAAHSQDTMKSIVLRSPQVSHITGWWQLKYFLFSPRSLGKMNPIWRSYFSTGLKPPTRLNFFWNACFFSCFPSSEPIVFIQRHIANIDLRIAQNL